MSVLNNVFHGLKMGIQENFMWKYVFCTLSVEANYCIRRPKAARLISLATVANSNLSFGSSCKSDQAEGGPGERHPVCTQNPFIRPS